MWWDGSGRLPPRAERDGPGLRIESLIREIDRGTVGDAGCWLYQPRVAVSSQYMLIGLGPD